MSHAAGDASRAAGQAAARPGRRKDGRARCAGCDGPVMTGAPGRVTGVPGACRAAAACPAEI
ncbi:MAG TPA: hypothetical protein VE733_00100, partial [Streptosporangiaceae bacterium]|nr:hypothetical protein [Streptosporangiaceae bacterium]